MRRCVEIAGLVQHRGAVFQRQEAVGKARRNPGHALVLGRQHETGRLAEGGRATADVHGHVEDGAFHHADKLALRLLDLIVQTAQHALGGMGLVVLHEFHVRTRHLVEDLLVVAFVEIATAVAEHLRFDQENVRQGGIDTLHQKIRSVRMVCRYWP